MSTRIPLRYVVSSAVVAALAAMALAQHDHAKQDKEKDKVAAKSAGDAYPFATCPISGKKLSDPVTKTIDGRQVSFCCNMCPDKFSKESAAKLDAKVIQDQSQLYPSTTSVVTGKALPEKPFEFVYGYRLVRLGSEAEKADFLKDAPKYLADLDKAVIATQAADYPLETCLVSKDKLGAVGKPVDVVRAGRLFKLCCGDCKGDLDKHLADDIAKLDEARAAKSKPGDKKDTKAPSGADKK